MEPTAPRMKGKKLKEQSKIDGNNNISHYPSLPSSCLSSSIPDDTSTSTTTSTTPTTATSTSVVQLCREEPKKEIPKLVLYADLSPDASPPISPARMSRSKIWLGAKVNELDSSLFYTNLGSGLYRMTGTITCTKPNPEKDKELKIYFESSGGKQIKEIKLATTN